MSYCASYNTKNGFVEVKISGENPHADHIKARDEALRLCLENQCCRMLVDLRKLTTNGNSTIDCFLFGKSTARLYHGICLSYVVPKNDEAKKDVQFISTVEINRGFISQGFESIDEAKKWLCKKHN